MCEKSSIATGLKQDSCRGPIYGPRVIMWTKLNPHVLMMLLIKY